MLTKRRLVNLGSDPLEYSLRLSRRSRRVRLSVHRDGRVVVSGPRRFSIRAIENFIQTKAAWITEKKEYFKSLPKPVEPFINKKDFLVNKEKARQLVLDRILFFNKVYQQKFNRVLIRNQKTRWGSCSSRRNLSFNYRVALLPSRLFDYIIVHELCHLIEMNHSARFWRQVEKTIPDYNIIRQELRAQKLILT